jgi:hypothetical protein
MLHPGAAKQKRNDFEITACTILTASLWFSEWDTLPQWTMCVLAIVAGWLSPSPRTSPALSPAGSVSLAGSAPINAHYGPDFEYFMLQPYVVGQRPASC